jgi:hypothetical protein
MTGLSPLLARKAAMPVFPTSIPLATLPDRQSQAYDCNNRFHCDERGCLAIPCLTEFRSLQYFWNQVQ